MKITARIYWDEQDSRTVGWGWATKVDGEHDSTGPLGDGYAANNPNVEFLKKVSDEELVEAFHREVNNQVPAEDIEIVR